MRIVIFRHTPIGDTVIAFPILRELRRKYKDDHITFIGNPAVVPLALAWGLADEAYEADAGLLNELYADEGIHTPEWLNLFQQTDLAISLQRNRTDELIRNLHKAGAKEVIAANEFRAEYKRTHRELWERFRAMEASGVIDDRTAAINRWVREKLDELDGEER